MTQSNAQSRPSFFRARLSPDGYLGLHLTIGAVVLLVAIVVFGNIAEDLVTSDRMVDFDLQVSAWFSEQATPSLTRFFILVTTIHNTTGVLILTVMFATLLAFKKEWDWVLRVALSVPLGMLLNVILKNIFQRARPSIEHPLLTLATYSFPSGHAAAATLFYGVLGAYMVFASRGWLRVLGISMAIGMVALVGLSRIYLGVHYLSDVVAAMASSIGWLAIAFTGIATWRNGKTFREVSSLNAPRVVVCMGRSSPAKIVVILNAAAGSGCTRDVADSFVSMFAERGLDACVMLAKDGSELVSAAKQAVQDGAIIVVAGGGDGTLNAIASALVGTDVVLGILPLGTLNHFAKDLGIPMDVNDAIRTIAAGYSTRLDTAEVNGRVFLNNSSLGLYPDTVKLRELQQSRLGRGKWLAFLWAAISSLRRYPFLHVTVTVDQKSYRYRTPFIFIGNNEYVMEGFNIGARTQLDTGRLSFYLPQGINRLGLIWLALRAISGTLRQAKDFVAITAQSLIIESRHQHIRVATDGEVNVMRTPLMYRICPASLNVLVPQHPAKQ